MIQSFNHDYRMSAPPNADPEKKALNDIAVPVHNGSYYGEFKHKLDTLEHYKQHKFRSDGVMALQVVVTFSKEDSEKMDLEEWKKDNIEWLRKEFNANPEKYGDNLVSMVYHMDEPGNIHGHAIIIPVDDKGKINASYYTKGRQKLIALQDSYGKAMQKHGLKRGLKESRASHTDIKRYYATLNNAIYGTEMPVQWKDEPIEEYIERLKDAWKTERDAHLKELNDLERKIIEIKSTYKTDIEKDVLIEKLEEELGRYKENSEELIREFGSMENAKSLAETLKLINHGIQNHPDEELANRCSDDIQNIVIWSEEDIRAKEKGKNKASKEQDQEQLHHEIESDAVKG